MDNFENIQKFSNIILEGVKISGTDYIDYIIQYCEKNNLDVDSIVQLISPNLKQKMEEEAISMNMIKSSTHHFAF